MNEFLTGPPGSEHQVGFEDLSEILRGRSILALSDFPNENYLVLELSGDLKVSLSRGPIGVHISLVSTTGLGKTSPLLISLGDMPRRVSLNEMQRKLNGLRTLYAMYFLIYSDRAEELGNLLRTNPDADIENALLSDDERLCVESISQGSWNLVVWAKKFVESIWALGSIVALVYEKGRDAFLRKLEAEARIKEGQAEKQAIENERQMLELQMARVEYVLKITNKFGDPETKKIVQKRITLAAHELVSGDKHDYNAGKILEQI